ncbi:MAG TPA: hypothetical protein EYQ74_05445 [Planctomycetes bacterium]|nr:hypothetical protein [Planctomycetota bacterium]HIK60749.1 hypothetical protein [Planctomycetota bacterium]
MKSAWLILCTCTVFFVGCGLPPGQKLLTLEIHQAEVIVLETHFDADDTSTTSELWDASGERPFSTQVAAPALQPTDADSLRAHLSGPVEIRIVHVDYLEASASLNNLILVRSSPTADDWHLPAAEIQRAKKASGL